MKLRFELWATSQLRVEMVEHRIQTRYTLRLGRAGVSLFVKPHVETVGVVVSVALWFAWAIATVIAIL